MKTSITIEKALHKVWKAELTNILDCSKETNLHRNTITKAKNTGKCTEKTMDLINVYLLKKRSKLIAAKVLIGKSK